MQLKSQKMETPKMIWGQVVSYLREHRQIALHIACGDITEVDLKGNEFYIYSTEKYLVQVVSEKDNFEKLQNAFKSIGKEYNINIIKIETDADKQNEDIKKLKELVGNKLTIKE